MLPTAFVEELRQLVGEPWVRTDGPSLEAYGQDSLARVHPPDVVVVPGTTLEVSAVAEACSGRGVPLTVRGGGTGFTGGSVPLRGGVVLSMERFDRILEIDEENLLAVVQPNVVTGVLQAAVERLGLFYPPDPASLDKSVIGGNIAECAGGPRAFKYGTTRRYVLGLEAVLPGGEVIRTGSKAVKNVVGYDLTQLLVGSEGTLAIITQAVLRLVPRPPASATLRATFPSAEAAVEAVSGVLRSRVVPATLELVDRASLEAVGRYLGEELAPAGTEALLLIEVDGLAEAVAEEARRVAAACGAAGATEVLRAASAAERDRLWRVRRELSPALKTISPTKLNHDVVVPRGRIADLFGLIEELRRQFGLTIACFGHAGDGNIHVNLMVHGDDPDEMGRARRAEQLLFEGIVAREGSISGEHGIGFTKAPYLGLELSAGTIALMKRVKHAFDPQGILNPGKIWTE